MEKPDIIDVEFVEVTPARQAEPISRGFFEGRSFGWWLGAVLFWSLYAGVIIAGAVNYFTGPEMSG